MSKLTNEFYNGFCVSDLIAIYESNNLFTTEKGAENESLVSGATMSSNSANNAINSVIKYLGEDYEN